MSNVFNKVLILSATSGAGHVKAGEALHDAFKDLGLARQVKHVDALTYTSPLMKTLYSRSYLDLVNKAPHLLGALYDATDKQGRFDTRRLTFDIANALPLMSYLVSENPDIIVNTHFLGAEIVALLKRRHKIHCFTSTVVTDFDVHAFWKTSPCEIYCAALPETAMQLEQLGVRPDQLVVTGIPVSPAFNQPILKRESKLALGLAPDRKNILVSNGGFGVGPMLDIVEAICRIDAPYQAVILAGKNEHLQAELRKMVRQSGFDDRIHVIGYTSKMRDYMAASDLMVGKSGGLTSSECLASGLPMVILNPIPGQEERNATHLVEHGCAVRCHSLRVLPFKLEELLRDESKLPTMQENASKLGRPDAAKEAARAIANRAEILKGTATTSEHPERKRFALLRRTFKSLPPVHMDIREKTCDQWFAHA